MADNLINYVKFQRGTPSAYKNLSVKDEDTLYFVSEADSITGVLYLGEKLISSGNNGDIIMASLLKDLSDVDISNVADKDLLGYDAVSQKWVPVQDQDTDTKTQVFTSQINDGEDRNEAILNLTNGITVHTGDFVILKVISSIVAVNYIYIYDGSEWILINNINNSGEEQSEPITADNVNFVEDFYITENLGKIETEGMPTKVSAAGKNLSELLTDLFFVEKNPTTEYPVLKYLSISTDSAVPVGTTLTPICKATFNAGSYTYGPETEVKVSSWEISDTYGYNTTLTNMTDLNFTMPSVVITDEPYQITIKANYTDGTMPITNTGVEYAEGQIKASSLSHTFAAINGYFPCYYGIDTTTDSINANLITNLTNSGNPFTLNKITFTAAETKGATKFIIALPVNSGLEVKTAILTSTMGVSVLDLYEISDLTINDIQYKVYTYAPASIGEDEIHDITIG